LWSSKKSPRESKRGKSNRWKKAHDGTKPLAVRGRLYCMFSLGIIQKA